ncbi:MULTISPECIES: SigE family RNA polymerase sigma factor [unclassified Nocardioides]|uniref:SigE family RNA polymerase sigma factor n=1 Tax=unclassified Nocardioides TaxID=2615069 RepID=UPI0006FAA049|nr:MULTISPECIES: SigE family RNA polymerase sigma factor [unclassified Nocardioides]KQY57032.1 hypothetical protein ASD30_12270 [Nocardioides sp. Root140]KQZ66764.1 hypothetical protein ASD66_17145 [Nocardioides sp. Root151]KRF13156.1 hypothetical protein ASH02_16915 [Nocardioides sp. Soil796]
MRKAERDAAFSEYVAARQGYLRRFAYTLTSDWGRAEDLLQTALTKMYVAWPRLRDDRAHDAYARRVILNAHIDDHRRPARQRESPGLDGLDAPAPPGSDPDDRSSLLAALDTLPPMQRKVVVLRHWLDFSVEQTAHELSIAPGTVKAHTHHALNSLRAALGEELPEMTRN